VSDWDGGALATLAGGCNPGLSYAPIRLSRREKFAFVF